MAEFNTFDLGRVFQTAEAIKSLRRQGTIDKLQEQYLGQRIQAGQQEMDIQKRTQETILGKEKAQQVVAKSGQILQAPNPKNYVEQFEPDLVKALTAQGVDWATADDNTVKQMVTAMQNKANQELGQAPLSTQQVGGFNTLQQGGKVIASAAPKQATPDALTERWKQEVQNGYQGSLLDYQKELKAAGRAPNVQQPPSGYQWGADGRTLEPVKGGPADMTGPGGKRQAAPLRKEFRSLQSVKDYETVLPLIKSAEKAPDTGYGDLQLIYTAGKILDPGSVVREGELALTIASGTPLQRILGSTRFSLEKGGRLTPKTREQIVSMLGERVGAYQQAYQRDYQQYSDYASDVGIDPVMIVGKPPETAYAEPQAQAQGAAGQSPQISGDADYAKLPSGSQYIAPDGSVRKKR